MTNYDYLCNKEYFGDSLNTNHFTAKKLYFRIVDNGTILPFKDVPGTEGFGGLIDAAGNFLPRSSIHMGVGGAYTPDEPVQYIPTTAIYIGMLMDIWGHCLTDNIKRLWFLKSDIYNKYFKNCPLLYTSMWGGGF